MGTYQAGVPSAAERTGDFGEVCGAQGGTFDSTGLCTVAQGQIWDPYSGVYNADLGAPVRSTFVPYNNLAAWGEARRSSGQLACARRGAGGWIWRGAGGRPIAFTTYDGTQLPTYGSQRPNLTGTPKRSHQKGWINNYFTNPGVIQLPPVYALGMRRERLAAYERPHRSV
jgi:hypothetical protein